VWETWVGVRLERPVNVGVTVVSNKSGFPRIHNHEARTRGRRRSPNYHTKDKTSHENILSIPSIVKGFTANNLKGFGSIFGMPDGLLVSLGELPDSAATARLTIVRSVRFDGLLGCLPDGSLGGGG
jgi:hypothetical protein